MCRDCTRIIYSGSLQELSIIRYGNEISTTISSISDYVHSYMSFTTPPGSGE